MCAFQNSQTYAGVGNSVCYECQELDGLARVEGVKGPSIEGEARDKAEGGVWGGGLEVCIHYIVYHYIVEQGKFVSTIGRYLSPKFRFGSQFLFQLISIIIQRGNGASSKKSVCMSCPDALPEGVISRVLTFLSTPSFLMLPQEIFENSNLK